MGLVLKLKGLGTFMGRRGEEDGGGWTGATSLTGPGLWHKGVARTASNIALFQRSGAGTRRTARGVHVNNHWCDPTTNLLNSGERVAPPAEERGAERGLDHGVLPPLWGRGAGP